MNRCGGWKSGQKPWLEGGAALAKLLNSFISLQWTSQRENFHFHFKAPEQFNFSPRNFTKRKFSPFLGENLSHSLWARKCSHPWPKLPSGPAIPNPLLSTQCSTSYLFSHKRNNWLTLSTPFLAMVLNQNHVFDTSAACASWQSIIPKCQQPHPMTYMDL